MHHSTNGYMINKINAQPDYHNPIGLVRTSDIFPKTVVENQTHTRLCRVAHILSSFLAEECRQSCKICLTSTSPTALKMHPDVL